MPGAVTSWNEIAERLSEYTDAGDPDLAEVILALCKLLKGVGKLL